MIRVLLLCALTCVTLSTQSRAENPAKLDIAKSSVVQNWLGRTVVELHLTKGVPFRVFTLDAPARLVVDFRDLDGQTIAQKDLLSGASGMSGIRFGTFQPGWARMVADLTRPMLPDDIGMAIDPDTLNAVLTIEMSAVEPAAFAASSGVPEDALWPDITTQNARLPVSDDRFVVVLDPGHGGIDPGAERRGVSEKELMLDVALKLRESLLQSGDVEVVLTRSSDIFVSLDSRVAQAHQAGGDVFLSLHADALSEGGARGATVYTLSQEASDTASAHLAARHNRADVIAGLDLTGADDEVASVLLDLARQETEPRSAAFAEQLVTGLEAAGGPVNNRPLRQAGFSVLKSADIPSVLLEVGFLSSERDLNNILDPEWRAKIVQAIATSILKWRAKDERRRQFLRQ